ncbi:hypothetical protein NDU88_005667 [Pleurodeles waltl]|uniref:Uncharacterized protein n=1 Tax=Pleurodeles waltl TaxID=8319 RepID=A0AAV7MX47_PLEWA|nr:hypothetical protein NDU88_005667 [Pleurodeles waltl]
MHQRETQWKSILPQWLSCSALGVSGDDVRTPLNIEEPSHAELLAAIQGSQVALEGKIEAVAVEVNLLWGGPPEGIRQG